MRWLHSIARRAGIKALPGAARGRRRAPKPGRSTLLHVKLSAPEDGRRSRRRGRRRHEPAL